jgi:hypothetical protein
MLGVREPAVVDVWLEKYLVEVMSWLPQPF